MNLKYFKNNEGDYIIYRHSNCQYLDNYLYLQTIYTTFSLLPYDSTNMETFFDKQIPIILDLELHKLHLDINDILNIQILANYQNLDISNPIFTNNILDLNSIDNTNNFFKTSTIFHYLSNEITITTTRFNNYFIIKNQYCQYFRQYLYVFFSKVN